MNCTDDLTIVAGDTKFYDINVNTDITGWIFYFTVKAQKDDADVNALIKKVVTEHTDPTAGDTVVELTSSDTSIQPGKYYYEFRYKKPDSTVVTFLAGHYIVNQNLIAIS